MKGDMQMSASKFFDRVDDMLSEVRTKQMGNIRKAAQYMASSIAADRWVLLFGTSHSHTPAAETFPRTGSMVGFYPIPELPLSITHGSGEMGIPQMLFLETREGYAQAVLQNYDLDPRDTMVLFSQSGINGVIIDMALEAKRKGLKVIAITSLAHTMASSSRHSSGKRLCEVADVVIDNCVPDGDALLKLDGLDQLVGPGSTISSVAIIDALICEVAANLLEAGITPLVNVTFNKSDDFDGPKHMEKVIQEYRRKLRTLL
jgi:uncharacterized phosphosugar-binding protein